MCESEPEECTDEPLLVHTYMGNTINLLHPILSTLDIRDVAHHLSLINRFGGATIKPYSVAQHCVLASRRASAPNKLGALGHDAPEAFLGDMIRPIKYTEGMAHYRVMEVVMMGAMANAFGFQAKMHDEVKYVDDRLLVTEVRDLLRNNPKWVLEYRAAGVLPYSDEIEPWDARTSEVEYLRVFEELSGAGY